jgi:FixJ family two-component response regulator
MTGNPLWIAVVDDEQAVLKGLTRLLNARSMHARPYSSAREFLSALRDGLPQCLVLDLQMPEMNGVELLEHLKSEGMQIPTIIVTAHDDPAQRQRCERAGAVAFLLKPVRDVSLFAAIDAAGKIRADWADRP